MFIVQTDSDGIHCTMNCFASVFSMNSLALKSYLRIMLSDLFCLLKTLN